jgi:hypothetical protein
MIARIRVFDNREVALGFRPTSRTIFKVAINQQVPSLRGGPEYAMILTEVENDQHLRRTRWIAS